MTTSTTARYSAMMALQFSSLTCAAFIVGDDGRTFWRNDAMEVFMHEHGGIVATGDHSEWSPQFHRAVVALCGPNESGRFAAMRCTVDLNLELELVAIRLPREPGVAEDGTLIIMQKVEAIEQKLSRYSLTRREIDLAMHILKGNSVRVAASELAISYHTARKHVQAIFRKTGVRRQTELVSLLRNLGEYSTGT